MTSAIMKKRYFVPVLVLVFFSLIALSPFLLSSSSALNFFVTAVNKKIPGRLSIDSWLIGWQQGILCQNVVYMNNEIGIKVSAPSLTSNRGLMELVLSPNNLGDVHVDSPQVELSGSAINTFLGNVTEGSSGTRRGNAASSESIPFWDQVVVALKSRDGGLSVHWKGQDIVIALKNISIDSVIAAGVAEFNIGFQAMDQGFVEASGSLNFPAHMYDWLETITLETDVKVSSLQVAEILEAGAAISKLPRGNGVANADFHLKAVGHGGLEFNGLAEVTGVSLSGGFLDDNHPSFQKIHLTVEEGRRSDRGWSMKAFELVSDALHLKGSGEVSPENVQLNTQGMMNLPVLLDQFPNFFNVHESTFLETGVFDFTVDVNRMNSSQSMKLKANVFDVGGIFEGNRFFWDKPIMLLFNAVKDEETIQVNALQFDAPFAWAKGSGDLHSFFMDGELDLAKALSDLGALFQLDMSGSGKLEFTMKSQPEGRQEGQFKMDVDLAMKDFMLRHHDKLVIPLHQFSLFGGVTGPDTFITQQTGELDIQLVLTSWLGEFFLVVNGEKVQDKPFRGYFTTDSEVDLAQLTPLLQIFDLVDSKTRIAGTMQVQAAGFTGDASAEIRDLSAEITDFTLEGGEAVFIEPTMNIEILQPANEEVSFLSVRDLKVADNRHEFFRNGGGLNIVDFSTKSITLHNVVLEGGSGEAIIDMLMIPKWTEPYKKTRTQLSFSVDLEKVTEAFRAIHLIPGDTGFFGSANLNFLWSEEQESEQDVHLQFQVADFTMKRGDTVYIDSNDIAFSSTVSGQVPFGEMKIEEFKLDSSVLNIEATGKVNRDDDIQLLELSGSMQPTLERLSPLIGNTYNVDLKMQGQVEEQFVLRYPLWSKPREHIDKLGIISSLRSEYLVYNGIELRDVSLPFHFDNSTLHVELSSRISGGKFELVSDTSFMDSPPVIKTLGSKQVMTGVELNDSLVKELFSKFHPLFGVLTEPSGNIDVRLDSVWWPIGGGREYEASFGVIFDVRKLQFKSNAQLKNILTLFGIQEETVGLRDNEIYCIGDKGGIKCSPVRLQAGESEIVMAGTISPDREIDYTIELPITRKLVSEEGFQILKGTKVKVALKGTTMDPFYDKKLAEASIQSLRKQVDIKVDTNQKEAE